MWWIERGWSGWSGQRCVERYVFDRWNGGQRSGAGDCCVSVGHGLSGSEGRHCCCSRGTCWGVVEWCCVLVRVGDWTGASSVGEGQGGRGSGAEMEWMGT
jgi:hypothetical protein